MKNFITSFAGAATLALAVLPMAALTTAAHAQPAKMVVADLNLATPAGQKAAATRIAHLSHEVCADERNVTQRSVCETAVRAEAKDKVAAYASNQYAAR